jgi:chromosome segregation ATPase
MVTAHRSPMRGPPSPRGTETITTATRMATPPRARLTSKPISEVHSASKVDTIRMGSPKASHVDLSGRKVSSNLVATSIIKPPIVPPNFDTGNFGDAFMTNLYLQESPKESVSRKKFSSIQDLKDEINRLVEICYDRDTEINDLRLSKVDYDTKLTLEKDSHKKEVATLKTEQEKLENLIEANKTFQASMTQLNTFHDEEQLKLTTQITELEVARKRTAEDADILKKEIEQGLNSKETEMQAKIDRLTTDQQRHLMDLYRKNSTNEKLTEMILTLEGGQQTYLKDLRDKNDKLEKYALLEKEYEEFKGDHSRMIAGYSKKLSEVEESLGSAADIKKRAEDEASAKEGWRKKLEKNSEENTNFIIWLQEENKKLQGDVEKLTNVLDSKSGAMEFKIVELDNMVKIMENQNNGLNDELKVKVFQLKKKDEELKSRGEINSILETEICSMKDANFMVSQDKSWIDNARNEILNDKRKINEDVMENIKLKEDLEGLKSD